MVQLYVFVIAVSDVKQTNFSRCL